jgi:RNA polymerase sigma factor (sigma-70 family)
MQEIVVELEQQGLPGELQRLKLALLSDQNGMLTATRLRLARIAQARGVDTNAIDDVVQETLLEAWSHLGRLFSPAGFHAWIDEICRNVCRRYARSRQENLSRHVPFSGSYQDNESTPGEDDASPLTNILDPSSPDPLEALSRQELDLLLDRALGLLPEEARQVVEMCHLLELPHSEVAERMGIPVGALYTRLHRARRHLRQVLSGPLRREAAAFDLALEQEDDGGWFDTRLWCSCCGRCRLQGSFFETEPGGNVNLHARCPGCSERYGLDTVHSMGLVTLGRLHSFRPAWKRTMQGLTELVLLALHEGHRPCPWCGNLSTIQVADAETEEEDTPRLGPYRYWIHWSCAHCGGLVCTPGDVPTVDQVVYWSHPGARQFMAQHPHWLSTPGMPLEYAGQPALSFQLTDTGSAASLTVLAHRHTLRLLNT